VHWQLLLLEEGQHLVIQKICSGDGRFSRVQHTECHVAVGINEGLLVDTDNAFQIAHEEGVLSPQIVWMFGFDLATGFILLLFLFQRSDLSITKDNAFTGDYLLQGLEAFFEVLQIMEQLDRPDTSA